MINGVVYSKKNVTEIYPNRPVLRTFNFNDSFTEGLEINKNILRGQSQKNHFALDSLRTDLIGNV